MKMITMEQAEILDWLRDIEGTLRHEGAWNPIPWDNEYTKLMEEYECVGSCVNFLMGGDMDAECAFNALSGIARGSREVIKRADELIAFARERKIEAEQIIEKVNAVPHQFNFE